MTTYNNHLLDEIIVDNFAGGGGASTGIELATGRPVTIAINHDPDAIRMHKTNHPYTHHLCESVWTVDPVKECAGRPVGLAWFSPDCKHFSRAKGAKPVNKNIRGLAWIVLRWAGTVKPRIIIVENVPEFKTWGPVRRGKPIKSKTGQTFNRWIAQLRDLGYDIDYRELVAADYGTPTIRKRFFLIARCDGKPIVWPEPTHNKDGTDGKQKWRGAAEIIDWTLPCPSIFDTKLEIKERFGVNAQRPLADNTLRRVARGVDMFVIRNTQPFIVSLNHTGASHDYVNDLNEPFKTVTSKLGFSLVDPLLAPLTMHNNQNAAGTGITEPLNTVTSTGAGGHQIFIAPTLTAIGQTGGGDRNRSVAEPAHTQVVKAEKCLVAPSLIQYHTERNERVRGQDVTEPILTIDGSNRYGMAAAYMTEYFGNADRGFPLNDPTHTATAKDREGLTLAYISKFYKTCTGHDANEPLHTITTSPGHLGEVRTYLSVWDGEQPLYHWSEVRELLNSHCDYDIPDNMILVLHIAGTDWFISDIGLRILTPRELYAANGFPPDYIIDRDYEGREYSKSLQVARCGNAVPPPFAKALVKANWPEACTGEIYTMADFKRCVML